MARWDVQVLGLDDGRPVASVVGTIAQRLGAEVAQVERLLAHAPTTLVADLEEADAKSLVQELRALGVRVKPRPSASEPIIDARSTAPTIALPTPELRPSTPARSPLERMADGTPGGSGLELEDIGPPRVRASARPMPSTPPAARPIAPAAAPIAPAPREEEAPREFWRALPAAFLVPLRTPVMPGLVAAPIFMGIAVLCSILGTFTAIVGVLVMTAAFVGVTLQVSHRCLWATAVGERMPASLPSDFLSEYAFPGLTVVLVQGALAGLLGWAGMQMIQRGVPPIAVQGGMVLFALYGVVGFALAAASRSALGFLDVARIVRILVRAPIEVVAISIVGLIVQGGAAAIAVAQFAAAFAVGGDIGSTLLALAGSVAVVAFAAAYGSALSATMMGMLFWARPEVAAGG